MASHAASMDEDAFKTPKSTRVKSFKSSVGSPIIIPASPFMKKLGCGTGVNVYLMDRWEFFSDYIQQLEWALGRAHTFAYHKIGH